MINKMPPHLHFDVVSDLYKSYLQNGEIIPLEFKFAAFEVTKNKFNNYAKDILSERVRIGIDSGLYDLQKYADNKDSVIKEEISYDELIDFENRRKLGLSTPTENKTLGIIVDKILPIKVKQDPSFSANEARIGALANSCIKSLEYKLVELMNYNENPILSTKSEATANSLMLSYKDRVDFLATVVAMKEVLPEVHRKLMNRLSEREEMSKDYIKAHGNSSDPKMQRIVRENTQQAALIVGLKNEAANPSIAVLERALEVDKSLEKNFIERYPKEMKALFADSKAKFKHSF